MESLFWMIIGLFGCLVLLIGILGAIWLATDLSGWSDDEDRTSRFP